MATLRSIPRNRVSFIACLAGLGGCGGALEKVSESDVDAAQKAAAQRMGTTIYEACRSGRYEALGDDQAIPEMREALSPEKQKKTCETITNMSAATPEIRVVMDGSNKLSGFWLKPWTDTPR